MSARIPNASVVVVEEAPRVFVLSVETELGDKFEVPLDRDMARSMNEDGGLPLTRYTGADPHRKETP